MPKFPDYLPSNPSYPQIARGFNELREWLAANQALPGKGIRTTPDNLGSFFCVKPMRQNILRGTIYAGWVGASARLSAWMQLYGGGGWLDHPNVLGATLGPEVYDPEGVDICLNPKLGILHYAYQDADTRAQKVARWWSGSTWLTEETGVTLVSSITVNTGWLSAQVAADDAAVGTIAWSNPTNAKAWDGACAAAALPRATYSHYLKLTSFKKSDGSDPIPAGSTIHGVEIQINRNGGANGNIQDYLLYVVKSDGSLCATNLASADYWPASDAPKVYGGAADICGYTGAVASDINDADFGVVLAVQKLGPPTFPDNASVDQISVRIHYSPSTCVARHLVQLDTGGWPYVVYQDSNANAAKVYKVRRDRTGWGAAVEILTLPTGYVHNPHIQSLALDKDNKWHLLYVLYDGTNGWMTYYANEDGVDEAVSSGGAYLAGSLGTTENQFRTQLSIAPDGTVWVAGLFGPAYKAAYRTGASAWTSVSVVASPHVSLQRWPTIGGIDASGIVYLIYANDDDALGMPVVYVAKGDSGGFTSEEVFVDGGTYSSGDLSYTNLILACCVDASGEVMGLASDTDNSLLLLPHPYDTARKWLEGADLLRAYWGELSPVFVGAKGCRTRNQFAL